MATVPAEVEGPSDAELIDAVRKGTISAYGGLWERHVASAYNLARQLARSPAEADDLVSDAFAKVLDTLRAGRGPDSAFRAYLLTTLRHTAYDKTRRDRKVELSDDVSTVSGVAAGAVSEEFDDTAVAGLERTFAAQAFARLPERWQAVLWHTEIEGQSPVEVAPLLGLTPNGVSALAYRAREGLRQAYLQVHLSETTERHCRAAAERLGAWTRDGLSKRETAQVEAHLDTCARCRALAAELADVNGAMRIFIAPAVLGLGAVGYLASAGGATGAAAGTAAVAGGAAGSVGAATAGPRQFLGVAVSSVALAAALIVGLTVGGAREEIPAAAPVPSKERPAPIPTPPRQEPPAQEPPAPEPPPREDEPPAPAPSEPDPTPAPAPRLPAQQAPSAPVPAPARLAANGPSGPVTLVAGGSSTDLPLTVRNTGGSVSEPVSATVNLPAGVTALPVTGFAAPRLLSLNGAMAGIVNCPGGTGTVTCSGDTVLAPGASVTLLFRLVAEPGSKSGPVTGVVSAGSLVTATVTVEVDVRPPDVIDAILLTAWADWAGIFGVWMNPVVTAAVTNTGTSSRPVMLTVDQYATLRSSSQVVTCTSGDTTSCVTSAELAPGEKLTVVLRLQAGVPTGQSPYQQVLHVAATLGKATDSTKVQLEQCWWPTRPIPEPGPPAPSEPPAPSPANPTPTTPPTTTKPPGSSEDPPTTPSAPPTTPPTAPSPDHPPATSPPSTSPQPTNPPQPSKADEPSPGAPATGLLGGLLGWLLGG